MSLPKGSFNSGIKNLIPFSKGKSGYHLKKRKVLCQFCEKEFISTVEHAKFCSPKCRDRSRPNRQPKGYKKQFSKKCEFCGEDFFDLARRLNARFCSRQCSGMFIIANGELNYVYKAFLFLPHKCNRCNIDDDRVLCVHHIDHNRENNDLENLEIVCANCHHRHNYSRGATRKKKIESIKKYLEKREKIYAINIW